MIVEMWNESSAKLYYRMAKLASLQKKNEKKSRNRTELKINPGQKSIIYRRRAVYCAFADFSDCTFDKDGNDDNISNIGINNPSRLLCNP